MVPPMQSVMSGDTGRYTASTAELA